MTTRFTLSALALLLLAPLLSGGQAAPGPSGTSATDAAPPPAPADDQPDWLVGIAAFAGQGLSPDSFYLLHSIPLLLLQNLGTVRTHYFTEEEKLGYRKAVIRRAERKKGEQIEALRQERDALFFKESDPAVRAAKSKEYDLKIRRAVDELNALTALPPDAVAFPDSKNIRFASGDREEALLDAPLHSPLQAALQKSVNLLVWGRVEEVQGFLYFEVHALDSALQEDTFTYSDAVARDELPAVVDQVIERLKGELWGRDWASLAIQASPLEAAIYLDGILVGTGQARMDFVVPGEHELRVELDGYSPQTRSLSLQSYSLFELTVELESLERAQLALASEPPGAVVYEGSTRLGETPLNVPEPGFASRFLLRLPGYLDQALYLGGGAKDRLQVTLAPDSVDPLQLQKQARNGFYTAFGLFALSVPLPIFCWGFANDYAVGYSTATTISEQDRMRRAANAYYMGMWGTLGVSGILAVNMIVQLVRYIRAADRRG